MCDDFKLKLLGKIPLEPDLILCSEKGKSIINSNPTSQTTKEYLKIV